MPTYLIDTTVLIDHQRNRREATQLLHKDNVRISYISVMEMIAGAKDAKTLRYNRELTEGFLIDWGSEEINEMALELLGKYRLSMGIGMYDCILAATAIIKKTILVSDNLKHFKGIVGLKVKRLAEVVK